MCMNVDLPEPDGPVTATNSPRWTSRLTPRSAFTSTSPTMYVFTRLRTEMTVVNLVTFLGSWLRPSAISCQRSAPPRRKAGLNGSVTAVVLRGDRVR